MGKEPVFDENSVPAVDATYGTIHHPNNMTLFEVASTAIGASYFRVYVWAHDAAAAKQMSQEAFDQAGIQTALLEPEALLHAQMPAFVTKPDDEGWAWWGKTSPMELGLG